VKSAYAYAWLQRQNSNSNSNSNSNMETIIMLLALHLMRPTIGSRFHNVLHVHPQCRPCVRQRVTPGQAAGAGAAAAGGGGAGDLGFPAKHRARGLESKQGRHISILILLDRASASAAIATSA
jgi:hypothetical protein